MALPTAPASVMDEVYTRFTYLKIGGREYKDQHYKTRPLLKLLDERSLKGRGGPNIVHPVNLGTSSNGKSLGRNETFDIQGDANETWARYVWKTVIETCFVSWFDEVESEPGKYGMVKILDSRVDETRENLEDQINTMIAATSTAGNDITRLLDLVATSGAIGGLNPATSGQTDWASQEQTPINWSVAGIGKTRTGINTIEDNKGNVDVILLPDQYFNETCEIADLMTVMNQDLKTRGGTKYADLGAQVPLILNTPVIRDNKWNASNSSQGIGLDLSGVHMVTDPRWDMYMWPFKQMVHHGRLGQASVQIKRCQLTCSSRRTQLLLSSIS